MAVTSVSVNAERSGAIDERGRRTYVRTFTVETDDSRDGPKVVLAAPGIPRKGDPYDCSPAEHDDAAYAGAFAVECVAAGSRPDGRKWGQWKVTVTYGQGDPGQFNDNPLTWPLRLEWEMARYERVVDRTVEDEAIVNSAGVRFETPVTVDESRLVLKVVRNEATYDPHLAATRSDKVNSEAFLGAPPRTVKVAGIPGRPFFNNDAGGWYWEVSYTFEFNPDGWDKKILDQGYDELGDDGELKPFMAGGQKVESPKPLDGDGRPLPEGEDYVFLEFKVYEELDFNAAFGFDFAGSTGGEGWA